MNVSYSQQPYNTHKIEHDFPPKKIMVAEFFDFTSTSLLWEIDGLHCLSQGNKMIKQNYRILNNLAMKTWLELHLVYDVRTKNFQHCVSYFIQIKCTPLLGVRQRLPFDFRGFCGDIDGTPCKKRTWAFQRKVSLGYLPRTTELGLCS